MKSFPAGGIEIREIDTNKTCEPFCCFCQVYVVYVYESSESEASSCTILFTCLLIPALLLNMVADKASPIFQLGEEEI